MARLIVTSVVAAVLMLTSPVAAEAGRKYALLIGLDDYGQEKGITRLGYARKDVEEMQKALTALSFEFPERPLVNEVARRVGIVRDIKAKSALVLLDHCFSGDVTGASDRSRSLDSSSPTKQYGSPFHWAPFALFGEWR